MNDEVSCGSYNLLLNLGVKLDKCCEVIRADGRTVKPTLILQISVDGKLHGF